MLFYDNKIRHIVCPRCNLVFVSRSSKNPTSCEFCDNKNFEKYKEKAIFVNDTTSNRKWSQGMVAITEAQKEKIEADPFKYFVEREVENE